MGDVLAAGGVVVSDPVGGMHDLLGDIVPMVSDADQLADVVRRLLSDPDERRQIAQRGRDLVLRRHTFDHRAETLIQLFTPLLEGRPSDLDGNSFAEGDLLGMPSQQPRG